MNLLIVDYPPMLSLLLLNHSTSCPVFCCKSNNPSGRGDRQPGRPPKKNEIVRDFDNKVSGQ
ncbi:hypothetical protein NBRC110019_30590 [Neptunitalea chrysea]|uniref:Uncharacterized protein n=1 Tax=Neptunitalea chrysea TaxID=1647581 RepID=A0A9W6B7G4_9FLAO|nr:hypothetical protein NBRC110019_30590 [Neptunitalea chrysea]